VRTHIYYVHIVDLVRFPECHRNLRWSGSQARCQLAAECAVEVVAVLFRCRAFVVEVVFGV
jgi:hypothetical protein